MHYVDQAVKTVSVMTSFDQYSKGWSR